MGQLPLVVAALFIAGCSFLYNPNKIHVSSGDAQQPDAMVDASAIDAPVDAPPAVDADPSMLMVDDVAPHDLYEGQGVDNSPPQLLVLEGLNFTSDAVVTFLRPDGSPETRVTPVMGMQRASGTTKYLALQVQAAVDPTFMTDEVLTIQVSEGATTQMLANKLTLHGLPELTTNTLDPSTIDGKLYSQIDITGDVSFTSTTNPATLHAISSITIMGSVKASGSSMTPGPGGCAGAGSNDSVGGCSGMPGGGLSGASSNGGGGGGFNGSGDPGTGTANSGGAGHGDATLASLASMAGNQSSGGGGGLKVEGGGGGGTVELVAGGDITIGGIDASGGPGATGVSGSSGLLNGNNGGGGGGGGSGGVILLRTAAGALAAIMPMVPIPLDVAGGAGGQGGAAGGGLGGNGSPGNPGGKGASGRIRCDAPGGIGMCTGAHRGPSFATGLAVFQTDAGIEITLDGTSGDIVDFYDQTSDGVIHDTNEPLGQMFVNDQLANVHVSLFDGYNKLCATLKNGTRGTAEADTCIELAYLP